MRLPFRTDADNIATLRRLGLVILQTDEVIEGEFPWLLGTSDRAEEIRLHVSRVPSGREVTPESLARMKAALPAAVDLLPPEVPFDVIGYACTSGATIIGEAAVEAAVQQVRPGAAVTSPLTAAKAALKSLGVRRLAFVSPYVAAVSTPLCDRLGEAGFDTVAVGSFDVAEDGVVARMTPACILEAVLSLGAAQDCEAVFVSCTNLRAARIVEEAEARLGKPVVTSNQALAWHMLRLAGVIAPLSGRGRLFLLPPG